MKQNDIDIQKQIVHNTFKRIRNRTLMFLTALIVCIGSIIGSLSYNGSNSTINIIWILLIVCSFILMHNNTIKSADLHEANAEIDTLHELRKKQIEMLHKEHRGDYES